MTWEDRDTKKLVNLYEKEKNVFKLADILKTGHRNVIGKLVSLGVYDLPKEKYREPTVKQMVRDIEEYCGIRFLTENLNKKENVKLLWEWVQEDEKG